MAPEDKHIDQEKQDDTAQDSQRPQPSPEAPAADGPAPEERACKPDMHGDERLSPNDIDFQPPLVICLSIISRLMGKPVSSATLKAGIPQQEGVITAASIVRAAERIGIVAKTVHREKLREITKLVMPCILLLRGGNACVLLDTDDLTARVVVPGHGMDEVEMPLAKLEEEYTGYAIFCHRKSRLDKRVRELRLVKTKRWFWGVILSFWPIYRHVVVASIMTNLIIIASPLFVMNVYDRVIPNNATETLWALAIGIAIAYLCDFLLKNLRSYFVDVAGRNADVLIGSRIMQHLMSARLDHMPESAGAVANNVREFESLREFFSSSSLVALIDMPFLLLFIAVISYIGGPLAWPVFVAVPVVILFGLVLQVPFQHIIESHYKESTQKHALLFEIVQGLETIKTSMAEGRMQARWENVVGMSAMSNSRAKIMANISITFSLFITQMVSVAIIIIGVYLIGKGELTVGGLIACNILAGRSMAPLSAVAGLLARFQQSRMALQALDMLMELPSERPEDKETFHYGSMEPSIHVENVSFSYPGTDKAVLAEVNLTIRPGEKVGIVGRTGAGKSTLGKLCVGLYQPVLGSVKVGNIDLRQLDTAVLRRKVGYISQDSLLFYGTLKDNIAFGLPEGGRPVHQVRRRDRRGHGFRQGPSRRVRHDGRRAGLLPFRRPAPGRVHRPGHPARPGHPDHGRAVQQHGQPVRVPVQVQAGAVHQGQDGHRHHPPPLHARHGGPAGDHGPGPGGCGRAEAEGAGRAAQRQDQGFHVRWA